MCKNNCNCISDILKVIYLLQKNADREEDCILSCDKPSLGQFACLYYNTRPVMLYTCMSNGVTPWSAPTTRVVDPEATSSVFRIEKIDNCCATFRVLIPNTIERDTTYTLSNSYFTIDLSCVLAMQCLPDIYAI